MSKVPAPWIPVELTVEPTRAVAKVWGRTYVWDNSLMPVSITTAEREILAAPAELHALFGGKDIPFRAISYIPFACEEDKAVFTVCATADNITVNIRYTIEYDGFIEMALIVNPFWSFSGIENTTPRLNGLYFEFPLKAESANLYHYWPNSESSIRIAQVMASGQVPEEGIACPFKPYFWAGWEFGGLGIASETDEFIQLSPGTDCITLSGTGETRVLRVNLLNKIHHKWIGRVDRWECALEPLEYVFGIQATPVKQIREDRMDHHIYHHFKDDYDETTAVLNKDENGENLLDKCAKYGVNTIVFHEGWSSVQNYGQAANPEQFKIYVEECHKRGIKVLVYFGYEFATTAPEWHEKKDNYLIRTVSGNPVGGWQRWNPWQRAYQACYAGGYAEGMRERVKFCMDYYGVDGIYTDGTYVPWECANANHGCGYTDEQGGRHCTYPVFSVREHVKKLYEVVHSKEDGFIDTHQSSCLIAPTLAFADSFYNGESIQPKLQKEFIKFLNLPAYRTEYMGKNLGVFPQTLIYGVHETSEMTIQKAVSLSLIHDVLPRPENPGALPFMKKMWDELHDFGTGKAKWHPYWIDDGLVKAETADVFCSVYEKDGAYLAVVSSFNEETEEVVLTLAGDVKVEKLVPGEAEASAEGKQMKLHIKPYRPELIRFTLA